MRTAPVACGLQQHPHANDDQPPTSLRDMFHDLWRAKEKLATLFDTDTPQTRRHRHHCRTQIAHIRADLQQSHIHRQQRIAQEHEGYARHEPPYKAIRHLNNAMTNTGHRSITEVRQADGSLTSDQATVLYATQDSVLDQTTPTQDTPNTDTENQIDRLPQVFNHAQRRQLEKRPLTIREVRKALHSLRQHKTPGYEGLPAEAYYHFRAHLLCILAHRVRDIVTGQTPLPFPRAHLVPSFILPELNIHLKVFKMEILKLNLIHSAFIFWVILVPNLWLGACCRCRARACRCFCLWPQLFARKVFSQKICHTEKNFVVR